MPWNAEQFGVPVPTIRSLAKALGLAPATVSDALRGTGRVSPETAERVRRLAERSRYRVSPLTTAVMSDIRRSRAASLRGVIATVELVEPDRNPHGPFPRQIVVGARQRAEALGFHLEDFQVGTGALSPRRLNSILSSRGIRAVMLLPAWYPPNLAELDWHDYAGVYTDCVIDLPHLHLVGTDHYKSMIELLHLLYSRGYRRPGLVLESGRDERLQLRHSAAFRAFQESHSDVAPIPVLVPPRYRPDEFRPWFRRHKPDIVLSHEEQTIKWIEELRRPIPQECGFVLLNMITATRPCAGLDLQPQQIGARAIQLLIGQLQQNELGVPEFPSSTLLVARWVEGPTVRPPSQQAARVYWT